MRIVIDMQGVQTGNQFRDIGLYTFSLAKAIARNCGDHEIIFALNGLFPETVESIRTTFSGLLPQENIRVWHSIGPTREVDLSNKWRREVAERIRESFFIDLHPDVVLLTNLFEGFDDDAVTTVGLLNNIVPTVVILHELIPFEQLITSKLHKAWYSRKISWLKNSRKLLATSENVRQKALVFFDFDKDAVVNLSGTSDESFRSSNLSNEERKSTLNGVSWDAVAILALNALHEFSRDTTIRPSPLLNIELTSAFRKRQLRILTIKIDHFGDFILAIPALTKLKARYPYATFDIITGSWNEQTANTLGLFDNIYTYDFFKKQSADKPSINAQLLNDLLTKLGKYDIAIDLRRPADSRFLLAKVQADLKIGYETFDAKINSKLDIALRAYFEAPAIATPLNKISIANQMISLVDAIPANINDFVFFPDIGKYETPTNRSIAIFPKAGNDTREWDKSDYIELTNLLINDSSIEKINIYFASLKESADFEFISHSKLHINTGLNFADLVQSLSKNSVCIANNSGGAHLASYIGLTVIGIYSGHELSSEWAPQFNDSYVIHLAEYCSPCHDAKRSDCPNGFKCLNDISVSDVYTIVKEAIINKDKFTNNKKMKTTTVVSLQQNSDTIVNNLLFSIARLIPPQEHTCLLNIAEAISKNHPSYPVSQEISSLIPCVKVGHKSLLIDWQGFSSAEPDFRWTEGDEVVLSFNYFMTSLPPLAIITLIFNTFGKQQLVIYLNDKQVSDVVENGENVELNINVDNLFYVRNKLKILLPDAKVPERGDNRKLAIALKSFEIKAQQHEEEQKCLNIESN